MAKKRPKRHKRGIPETPTCNCILLCDDVVISQGKGKHTLQGVIGAIVTPRLPSELGGYVAYIRVQNVYGNKMLVVSLDEASTGEPVFAFQAGFPDKKDPLDLYTICVPVKTFRVHQAGLYWFTVRCDNEILAQSPIRIVAARSTEDQE
jgi:hypothetical protein